MTQLTIKIGNSSRTIQAPETWDALSLRQLGLYYQTLFTTPGSEYTASGFTMLKLLSMTQHVLNVDSGFMAQWEADCLAEDEENGQLFFLDELRQVIHSTLGGLFNIVSDEESGATSYSIRLNRTKNPWPALSHTPTVAKKTRRAPKTTYYYAPADGLGNITIYELAHTFTIFENYLKTNDDALANQLIAILYRPSRPETVAERESGWFGDRRQPLRKHEAKIAERAAMVATLPMLTRRLILFWFASCRQQIVNTYTKVFKPADSDAKPGYGWGGVLLAMAGGPTGLDAIADQHYSNGLTWLSMKEDERRELEAMQKKRRKD